jgi:Protein of unknown function (DUF3485)
MARFLIPAMALSAIVVSGAVHGYWTGRWDSADKAEASAALLRQLPAQLGDWQGQDLPVDPAEVGKVSAYLYRRYVNQRNGASVAVILASGRPGPVSIHTPDVCYTASGYESARCQVITPGLDPSLPAGEFKTAHFVKTKSAGQTHLRVFWAWNAGAAWSVPENPRLAFAGYPVLYKLHMVRDMASASEPLEEDPCMDLLRQLVAAFHKSVISKS